MVRKVIMLIVLLLGMSCSKDSNPSDPNESPETTQGLIALYDDRGVWTEGLTALEQLLASWGHTVDRVNAAMIIDGALEAGYSILVMPGGRASWYKLDLEGEGSAAIRRFVTDGGGFIGICAGAFFAADRILWYGTEIDYPLDLVAGYAIGPLPELAPPGTSSMVSVRLAASHPVIDLSGVSGSVDAYYYDGPRFELPFASVFAWYEATDAPAAATAQYGNGRVAVTGFHPEMNQGTHQIVEGIVLWVSPSAQSAKSQGLSEFEFHSLNSGAPVNRYYD